MQATAERIPKDALPTRLRSIYEATGDTSLLRISEGLAPEGLAPPSTARERQDAISSCLMACYRKTGDEGAFSLLFALNSREFLSAIRARLRRGSHGLDPHDVLQEVFLNIYRYPSRFAHEGHDSFRRWGYRILYNTTSSLLDAWWRGASQASLSDAAHVLEDTKACTPLRTAADSESAELVDFAYLMYLNLYATQYARLSPRAQRAMELVEIIGAPYKAAAAELGITIEHVKVVVFRGRRKIHTELRRLMRAAG